MRSYKKKGFRAFQWGILTEITFHQLIRVYSLLEISPRESCCLASMSKEFAEIVVMPIPPITMCLLRVFLRFRTALCCTLVLLLCTGLRLSDTCLRTMHCTVWQRRSCSRMVAKSAGRTPQSTRQCCLSFSAPFPPSSSGHPFEIPGSSRCRKP